MNYKTPGDISSRPQTGSKRTVSAGTLLSLELQRSGPAPMSLISVIFHQIPLTLFFGHLHQVHSAAELVRSTVSAISMTVTFFLRRKIYRGLYRTAPPTITTFSPHSIILFSASGPVYVRPVISGICG